MAASCSYCGATLNFGLKFCVVCGRQTIAALNKMGGIKSGVRHADTTKRMSDQQSAQTRSKRRALRFRRGIRTLSQTVFYGFVAGALFFCAVRVTLQALFPGKVNHLVAPILQPLPKIYVPQLGQFADNAAKFWKSKEPQPHAKPKKARRWK
ncbi:MAG: hypothetical protein C5B53_03715 [Candidatus Melainabacteria bacterium]|nr:MAG: hypothetical protein C5B53_03715 [Candidatus Melainabacteria bacterium]